LSMIRKISGLTKSGISQKICGAYPLLKLMLKLFSRAYLFDLKNSVNTTVHVFPFLAKVL
jgi:hypothetical protein